VVPAEAEVGGSLKPESSRAGWERSCRKEGSKGWREKKKKSETK
jgi:hypothetical protein